MMKNYDTNQNEHGFTMIEMMITMVIALVIMGGMSGLFVSQTRTAQVLNSKSEILNDLFLASQIMQFELRGAKAICWESGTKSIRYQPLTSSSAQDLTVACSTNHVENGFFKIKPTNSPDKPTPYICWDRQDNGSGCQELLRGMKAHVDEGNSGMAIDPYTNVLDVYGNLDQSVRTITLTAQYLDREHNVKDLSLSFKVWPRNTQ